MRKWFFIFISLAVLAAAVYFMGRLAPSFLEELGLRTNLKNIPISPDFNLTNLSGQAIKLSDFRERIVILGFWTSWNKHSLEQLKILNDYHKYSLAEKVTVLTVNSQEDDESVRAIKDSEDIQIEMLLDKDGEVGELYGVSVLPMTVFIDSEGREIAKIIGPISLSEIREKAAALRR